MKNRAPVLKFTLLAGAALFAALPAHAAGSRVTGDPLPADTQNRIYSHMSRAPETSAADVSADLSDGSGTGADETPVGHKVDELRAELSALQNKVAQLADRLSAQEGSGRQRAAGYYAAIATINTQLQVGTTPGNPRLVAKLNEARGDLDQMSGNISILNGLAAEIGTTSAQTQYLLQASQASYSLSGAVEEDHMRLAKIEDGANGLTVAIDRMLNNVNDDLTRTTAYIGSERENLRTLSLAVQTGDLFGKSLSNHSFGVPPPPANFPMANSADGASQAPQDLTASDNMNAPAPASDSASNLSGKPLVKIRFDKPDVSYEQPLYAAVNDALSHYPNAHFQLVAVHPNTGNAAEVAIESTRARRDAERVLRSLTQMGLTLDKIDLSYAPSADATSDEVRLFVR